MPLRAIFCVGPQGVALYRHSALHQLVVVICCIGADERSTLLVFYMSICNIPNIRVVGLKFQSIFIHKQHLVFFAMLIIKSYPGCGFNTNVPNNKSNCTRKKTNINKTDAANTLGTIIRQNQAKIVPSSSVLKYSVNSQHWHHASRHFKVFKRNWIY